MFSHLIGNEKAKNLLEHVLQTGAVPPIFLFSGPSGVGKVLFAQAFSRQLTLTQKEECPDIHLLVAEGKGDQHPIAQIRDLLQEAHLPPFESPCKVFILEEAEKMLSYASNALLKVLEEPPPRTFFILTSSDSSRLLSTILSRCCKLSFFPIPEEELTSFLIDKKNLAPEEARKRAILSEGSLGKALLPPLSFDVEVLFKTPDYPTLLALLSTLENDLHLPEDNEALRKEQIDALFEEILFYVREKEPHLLERTLKQVMEARVALVHNLKLKTVLEHLFLNRPTV